MDNEAYHRLRWRCIRRGLLELDLILTRFLDEELEKLNEAEVQAFSVLADMDDLELWGLINGSRSCSDPQLLPLVERLRVSVR